MNKLLALPSEGTVDRTTATVFIRWPWFDQAWKQIAQRENHQRWAIHYDGIIRGKFLSVRQRSVWAFVSRSPLRSLWSLQGIPVSIVANRVWKSLFTDRLFGRAAELGFYFLFALFPTLFSASSMLGFAAQSADKFYDEILKYLSLVIPTDALGAVLATFNETTAASTPGKLTFGLVAAIWSAAAGISAIQDALNAVYKLRDTRSFLKAHVYAIGLTILLTILLTLILSSFLGGDFVATVAYRCPYNHLLMAVLAPMARLVSWIVATALLALAFAVIYYWCPDVKVRCWHWLTPGGSIAAIGWVLASLGLRIYLHFFNSYSITYGSLGAVIILLTWFYISGFMLLLGAEVNCAIEAATAKIRMAGSRPIDLP